MKFWFVILLELLMSANSIAQPPNGWKMTDRFASFRFELIGRVQGVGMRSAIQGKADQLACFGWVQNNNKNRTLVGEVRCNKYNSEKMKQWMTSMQFHPAGSFITGAEIKDYEDSKIKLFFSHFKNIDDNRETCFRDPPHQCRDMKFSV